METEGAPPGRRPRPLLLILLGLAAAGFLVVRFAGSAGPVAPASNPGTRAAGGARTAAVDPAALDVRLEALEGERPGPGASARNPFTFRAAEPEPRLSPPRSGVRPPSPMEDMGREGPPPPPAVPPITVKFLGVMQTPDGTTRALFTDCSTPTSRRTVHVREGEAVLGQYRLVKIGVESVVIEHLDGRGRTTLAKSGQECVWR